MWTGRILALLSAGLLAFGPLECRSATATNEGSPAREKEAAAAAKETEPNRKLLKWANESFTSGEYVWAEKAYRALTRNATTPSTWATAVFNLALTLKRRGRLDEAIANFEKLFDSPVSDTEPTARVMEAYKNYRHRTCLAIADCYEEKGDVQTALKYALMAREKHRYRTWCGTCAASADYSLATRINRLAGKAGREDLVVQVDPPPWIRRQQRRRNWLIGGAAAFVIAAGGVAVFAYRRRKRRKASRNVPRADIRFPPP